MSAPADNRILVTVTDALDNKQPSVEEILDYKDLYNSFKVNWQLNSTYEISFTATYTDQYKDAFNLLEMKRYIWYNNQSYVIQQLENTFDENGLPAVQVTANAALIDLMKNIRIDPSEPTEDNPETSGSDQGDSSDDNQQDPAPGTITIKKTDEQQTYTLQNRLDQFFNNNDQNITYELHGNFPQAAVECSGSLYEWLGSNLATFGAYYVPDGLVLKIYDLPSIRTQTDMVFRYMSNSSSVDIQSDGNDMVNDCEVYGGKMEKDITGSGSAGGGDGNGGNLDSVEGFCKSPVNADFGVNKGQMLQNFAARDDRVHAWGVDVNRLYDVIKQNGVSPEWFFAYDLIEGGHGWGWLNHTYRHGDAYSDAAYVCNWIKQCANADSINPAWSAPEGAIAPNPALAAKWNQEFGKGTIGRCYLQGTAAATWELAGQIPNPAMGRPLNFCVQTIKSWGGHTVHNSGGGWGWPFPNIPKNGEPQWINGQQFGHTGWIRPGSNTDFHDGFDFGASWYNGNVLAVHPGTVHHIGADLGWWYVWVKSNDGYNEVYQEGFTSRGDIFVNEGQQVNVGTPIGRVTGTHTHLGITNKQIPIAYYHGFNDDGTWLNPIQVIKAGINGGGSGGGATPAKPSRVNEFINYCKSFVGKVPYVWGGCTPSGWDCSGFVSYVLDHFGVNVGAHMTLGLSQLGQVVGPPYQTGDLLFWGPQGAWHHTSIAMDATYRVGADTPADGTVYRTISSYPPTFGVRVQKLVDILGGTGDSTTIPSGDGTTTETYYSLHYHYRDEESVKRYGLHRGAPVVMDSIYDLDALQKYVDDTVQHDPPTTLSNNQFGETNFKLGSVARLIVPDRSINFDVTLMGIEYNPFNPNGEDTTLTWNNTGLAMKNSIYALYQQIKRINKNVDHIDTYGATGGRNESSNVETDQNTSKPAEDSTVHFSQKEMEAIKAFTNS